MLVSAGYPCVEVSPEIHKSSTCVCKYQRLAGHIQIGILVLFGYAFPGFLLCSKRFTLIDMTLRANYQTTHRWSGTRRGRIALFIYMKKIAQIDFWSGDISMYPPMRKTILRIIFLIISVNVFLRPWAYRRPDSRYERPWWPGQISHSLDRHISCCWISSLAERKGYPHCCVSLYLLQRCHSTHFG